MQRVAKVFIFFSDLVFTIRDIEELHRTSFSGFVQSVAT